MDMLTALRERRSVRTFTGEPVPDSLLDRAMAAFIAAQNPVPCKVRLEIRPAAEVEPAMTGLIGGYGRMVGAPHYVIGLVEKAPRDQVALGYAMEHFVLEAWRAGIGTCWIGGYFRLSKMNEIINPRPGERVVCVSPVGFAKSRRFAERMMRGAGGLDRRAPLAERVFHPRWGVAATDYLAARPKWRELFEIVRWVPSASNLQPVHYVVNDDRVVLTLLRSLQRSYPKIITRRVGSEDLNFQGVDAGIAMAHVQLAAGELGLPGRWRMDIDEGGLRHDAHLPGDTEPIAAFSNE